jgi:hypothetical protein
MTTLSVWEENLTCKQMNVTIHSATERVKLDVELRDNPSCEILIKRKGAKPIHYKSREKFRWQTQKMWKFDNEINREKLGARQESKL